MENKIRRWRNLQHLLTRPLLQCLSLSASPARTENVSTQQQQQQQTIEEKPREGLNEIKNETIFVM